MDPAPIPVETLLAHREWVRTVAVAVVRDANTADDVEQETWVEALHAPPRNESSLRGWLGTVVRNRARRIGRSETRRATHESIGARAEATQSAAELAEVADTHRRVVQAVVELAEPYRQTILLRYFEGLAVEDVATRMSVPLDTARSRISRGLAKLRERLEREFGCDERPLALALAPLLGGKRDTAARVAAVGGAAIATTTAWAVGAAVLLVGLGAFWVMKANAVATEPVVVAAAPAPLFVPPPAPAPAPSPAPVVEETPKPVAPPVPVAEEPRPEPPKPASSSETAAQRLANVKLKIDWTNMPMLDAFGDLAAKTGVEIVASAEAVEMWGPEGAIERLRLEREVTALQVLELVTQLKALAFVVEEPRVVIVPAGVTRDPERAVVVPKKPDPAGPNSLTVKGVVVDENGAPVGHAAVLDLVGTDRKQLAETDASGAFTFETAHPFPAVFAQSPGHVPSRPVFVKGEYGTTMAVRLELGNGAAIVEGHVVDADGRDVEGASVQILNRAAQRAGRSAGRTLKTDAQGRFRDDAVPAGRLEVFAGLADTFTRDKAMVTYRNGRGEGRTKVVAGPAETVHVEVRLARLLEWRGVVRDVSGKPMAGVVLEGDGEAPTTAADGSFTMHVAVPRTMYVRIALPDGRTPVRWITIEPGTDLVQDVVIGAGWRIAGRVVPVPAGTTEVRLMNVLPWAPWPPWSVHVGGDGQFAFEDVAPGRYLLWAGTPGGAAGYGVIDSDEIDSGRDDLVLRATPERTATARIKARLVLADGSAAVGATLMAEQVEPRGLLVWSKSVLGSVTTGRAAPGRYRVWARVESAGSMPKGWRPLLIDAGVRDVGRSDLDLGTLSFGVPGRLRVRWAFDDDIGDTAKFRLSRLAADGARELGVTGEECDARDFPPDWTLSPGHYRLRVTGAAIQGVERVFDVRSNADTDIDVPLRAAPARRIRLKFPLGPPVCARVRISDDAGAFAHESDFAGKDPIAPLLPGRYRVDVDVTETITVHGTLDVPAENAPGEFDVTLR